MESATNTVVRDATRQPEWPSTIIQLVNSLYQPLPAYVENGPYPFLSTNASTVLREISGDPLIRAPASSEGLKSLDSPSLADVFDTVLSTVYNSRALPPRDNVGWPRTVVPLWSTLIQALCLACLGKDERFTMMCDVPFVLPQGDLDPMREHSQVNVADSIATLLVAHTIIEREISESTSTRGSSDENSREGSSERSSGASMSDISDESSSNTSQSSAAFVEFPLNAHITKSTSMPAVIHPLISVADPDTIEPLLLSVLHQRYAWRIDEPVVGLAISKTGIVAQIVFGWLVPDLEDPDALPTMRIAFVEEKSPLSEPVGVYRLTDPISALRLAQFILNLNPYFERIVAQTSIAKYREILWRSDNPSYEIGSYLKRKVGEETENGHSFSTSIHPPTRAISGPVIENSPSPLTNMTSSLPVLEERKSRGRPLVRNDGDRSSSRARSQSVQGVKSYDSSSKFSQRAGTILDQSASIAHWLSERSTLSLGRIFLNEQELTLKDTFGSLAEITEINSMISFYDEMSDFRWPSTWNKPQDFPKIDAFVRDTFDELLKNKQDADADEVIRLTSKTAGLDVHHTESISKRMTLLLWSSLLSSHLQQANFPVNEATSRQAWDALFYNFYVVQGESLSPNVLKEQPLNYARNAAVELKTVEDLRKMHHDLAEHDEALCIAALLAAKGGRIETTAQTALTQPKRAQAQNALLDAFDSLKYEEDISLESVAAREAVEPYQGICDAILVTSIPGALSSDKNDSGLFKSGMNYLRKFPLLQYPDPDNKTGEQLLKESPASKPPLQQLANPFQKQRSTSRTKLKQAPAKALQPMIDSARVREQPELAVDPITLARDEGRTRSKNPKLGSVLHISCSELLNHPTDDDVTTTAKMDWGENLHFPAMVVEHKKQNHQTVRVATNQCRLYSVSSVAFLSNLGIMGRPVFGLITNGYIGVVTLSWRSKFSNRTYILERNVRTFNLTNPLSAFQFATFLLRLAEFNRQTNPIQMDDLSSFLTRTANSLDGMTQWNTGSKRRVKEPNELNEGNLARIEESNTEETQD